MNSSSYEFLTNKLPEHEYNLSDIQVQAFFHALSNEFTEYQTIDINDTSQFVRFFSPLNQGFCDIMISITKYSGTNKSEIDNVNENSSERLNIESLLPFIDNNRIQMSINCGGNFLFYTNFDKDQNIIHFFKIINNFNRDLNIKELLENNNMELLIRSLLPSNITPSA